MILMVSVYKIIDVLSEMLFPKCISVSDGDMELMCLPNAFVWLEKLYFLFI